MTLTGISSDLAAIFYVAIAVTIFCLGLGIGMALHDPTTCASCIYKAVPI